MIGYFPQYHRYFVTYRFSAPWYGRSHLFSERSEVDDTLFGYLERGVAVRVIYLRTDPQISSLDVTLAPPNILMLLMIAVMCLGGILLSIQARSIAQPD